MMHFSARGFYWAGQYLEHIKLKCYLLSVNAPDEAEVFSLSRPLDKDTKDRAIGMLKTVEDQCLNIGLDITAGMTTDLRQELESDSLTNNYQWLLDRIISLQNLLTKELKGRWFFYSPPERAKFFPTTSDPFPFGASVADAFPSASYEINESAMCLALARSSASVFHLMRALEIGLRMLGAKFGISLDHTNWNPAIEQIESKIRDMHKDQTWKALPNCKELQELYAQAASTFGVYKDAWRNHTMHGRGKYTEDEAELIYTNVKAFLQKLAEIGIKETP